MSTVSCLHDNFGLTEEKLKAAMKNIDKALRELRRDLKADSPVRVCAYSTDINSDLIREVRMMRPSEIRRERINKSN